jgi:hypothetical protein
VVAAARPDYDWITPYLAQGGLVGTSVGQAYGAADVVIFCSKELQPDSSPELAPPPGKTEIRLPFDDTLDQTKLPWRDILRAVERGALEINRHKRVMVLCTQGRNRSGLVVGLILQRVYGISGTDAIVIIRAKRRPRSGGAPLANPIFEQLVRRGPR